MTHPLPLLAGLDLGTTTIKALICRPDGEVVGLASVPTPSHSPRTGWVDHDPEALWQAAAAALRQSLAQTAEAGRVVGIAVASVGETVIALDAQGRPVADAMAWFDGRAQSQIDAIFAQLGEERIFAVTGLPQLPIWGLAKFRWLQENQPDAARRTAHWLNLADYIAFRLSGQMVMDHSLASRTLGLDLTQREWAVDFVQEMGVDPRILPELAPSGVAIGSVTPEAAALTGLPGSAQVSTGGHDHICGAFALGVTRPGMLLDSMGSAEAGLVTLDQPVQDGEFGRRGYSQGVHVAGGYYALGGIYVSGVAVDWLRNRVTGETPYEILIQEASQVAAGSQGVTFLPRLRLANPGLTEKYPRGAFVGLTDTAHRGVLFRAVLEGLCFEYRHSLERLLDLADFGPVEQVLVTGGSIRNRLWLQIKASVLDQPLQIVHEEECTALGAAMLAGIGAGVYRSAEDAIAQVQLPTTRIEPHGPEAAQYAQTYHRIYLPMADALAPIHAAIHELYPLNR